MILANNQNKHRGPLQCIYRYLKTKMIFLLITIVVVIVLLITIIIIVTTRIIIIIMVIIIIIIIIIVITTILTVPIITLNFLYGLAITSGMIFMGTNAETLTTFFSVTTCCWAGTPWFPLCPEAFVYIKKKILLIPETHEFLLIPNQSSFLWPTNTNSHLKWIRTNWSNFNLRSSKVLRSFQLQI